MWHGWMTIEAERVVWRVCCNQAAAQHRRHANPPLLEHALYNCTRGGKERESKKTKKQRTKQRTNGSRRTKQGRKKERKVKKKARKKKEEGRKERRKKERLTGWSHPTATNLSIVPK